MKTAEAIFVLHGDISRKTKLLKLLGDQVYVVIWPGVDHKDAIKNLEGYDPSLHTLLEIGSREKLYIGRNNIIDWCKENGIKRFWMLDDDVTFRLAGPSQEFKDQLFKNGKYYFKTLEFEDEVGLGGLTMGGAMFNKAMHQPKFSNRFIWAAIFIDLDYNNIRYSVEGYDDIDMQLECVKNNIKTQTHNWFGQIKPNWVTKKNSLNSQIEKIDYNNYVIYKKWGDSVRIDIYYDKNENMYFRAHIRYPYKIENPQFAKYSTESVESFVASLKREYKICPENFKICGLPHLRLDKPKETHLHKLENKSIELF